MPVGRCGDSGLICWISGCGDSICHISGGRDIVGFISWSIHDFNRCVSVDPLASCCDIHVHIGVTFEPHKLHSLQHNILPAFDLNY